MTVAKEAAKRGRYGVLDCSVYIPQRNTSGYEVTQAQWTVLESVKAALFSGPARLHATETAAVAVWFGSSRGWTWLEKVPYPSPVTQIEWRAGCASCGSIVHASCSRSLGDFTPDPPTKESKPAAQYAPRGPQQPFSPEREYVSPEEKAELDEVGRVHPERVRLARNSVASSLEALRFVRNELREAKKIEDNHAAS